jgi:hypothetical protein
MLIYIIFAVLMLFVFAYYFAFEYYRYRNGGRANRESKWGSGQDNYIEPLMITQNSWDIYPNIELFRGKKSIIQLIARAGHRL